MKIYKGMLALFLVMLLFTTIAIFGTVACVMYAEKLYALVCIVFTVICSVITGAMAFCLFNK